MSDQKATAQAFGVKAYPTMFIVSTEGKVVWKGHFMNEEFLKILDATVPPAK